MVTYYNSKDMIDFGHFLTSKGRRWTYEQTQTDKLLPLEDRLALVNDADFKNWKRFQEAKKHHDRICSIQAMHHYNDDEGKCSCHRGNARYNL